MLRRGTCIGFLEDAGCGLIYADQPCEGSRVVFVHFRNVEPNKGWQGLNNGDRVSFVESVKQGELFHRQCAATGAEVGGEAGFVSIEGRCEYLVFSSINDLDQQSISIDQKLVITGDIPEGWAPGETFFDQADVLFYDCTWQGKAQFGQWKVQGDLVFLGCSFLDAFTLKEACINGAVHMEGCDFSGSGGTSFRGLVAESLYLDFGVKGPRDMVWLNEMHIQQDVVIGGVFEGTIQVMNIQDARVTTNTCKNNEEFSRGCFKRLLIGKEPYVSQNINRSVLNGSLAVIGLAHNESIVIDHTQIQTLAIKDIAGNVSVSCVHSKVLGNVEIEGQGKDSQCVKHLDFLDTYIEGHLTLKNIRITQALNLDDATIERVIRLHRVSFEEHGGLKLASLCANRLVMDDFSALYGEKAQSFFWKNPRFYMLMREVERGKFNKEDDKELVQEYVLLKHLLSQEGQLKLEDQAFYNMRKIGHWHQDVWMLLFNHIFGWGVRLQNILMSVAFMILGFAGFYQLAFEQFEIFPALQLSIQATFMAFFGAIKPEVMAGSVLSWIVLLQSVLGVIFVTVFVGAYVRKLLR